MPARLRWSESSTVVYAGGRPQRQVSCGPLTSRLSLLADAVKRLRRSSSMRNARAARDRARAGVSPARNSRLRHSQAPRPTGRGSASVTRPSRRVSLTSASLGATRGSRRTCAAVRRSSPQPSLRRHLLSVSASASFCGRGCRSSGCRQRHVGAALAVGHHGHATPLASSPSSE